MSDATNNAADEDQAAPLFRPMVLSDEAVDSVTLPGDVVMRFVNLTHSIADGAQLVGQILESEAVHDSLGDTPFLSKSNREVLSRLSTAALGQLVNECDQIREWAYKHHTDAGREKAARRH
jgi:hypothetical protein